MLSNLISKRKNKEINLINIRTHNFQSFDSTYMNLSFTEIKLHRKLLYTGYNFILFFVFYIIIASSIPAVKNSFILYSLYNI